MSSFYRRNKMRNMLTLVGEHRPNATCHICYMKVWSSEKSVTCSGHKVHKQRKPENVNWFFRVQCLLSKLNNPMGFIKEKINHERTAIHFTLL